MTFSEGFSTGNQKMCRDTLLASCPIQQSGAFFDRKKASASTLLWPANHFFHAWAHLPYLPGGLGWGGGGYTAYGLYGEAPPERGDFFRLQGI